ncbi:MAG: hypothetical protein CVT49_09545 [candidate division Zixibacteria bacterium HGW-Zixibacteria-1]|nr:MAG: hypothetical protein CVT49_09545 [candidate division Zixibacteria bacterium HGW-Zixibacteria-1]
MRKKLSHKLARWGLLLVTVIIAVFALQITVLAFPQMFVSKNIQRGSIKIFYDGDQDAYVAEIAEDVDSRLRATVFYDSTQNTNVYFLRNQGLYKMFVRLSMLPAAPQGFALSIFDNAFVDEARVKELAEMTGGLPKYSIYEGNPAHTIVHEVGHLIITGQIGRGTWKQLPHWKQEGFPEYIANISLIRGDSTASLPDRVAILNDDSIWGWKRGWDRIHYEAGLLVEFLLDVKGYTVEDIVADSVTSETTLTELLEWCRLREIPQ